MCSQHKNHRSDLSNPSFFGATSSRNTHVCTHNNNCSANLLTHNSHVDPTLPNATRCASGEEEPDVPGRRRPFGAQVGNFQHLPATTIGVHARDSAQKCLPSCLQASGSACTSPTLGCTATSSESGGRGLGGAQSLALLEQRLCETLDGTSLRCVFEAVGGSLRDLSCTLALVQPRNMLAKSHRPGQGECQPQAL